MDIIRLNPRVKKAILEKKPILVLESTLISHGLPYPDNLELMKEVFQICDRMKVVPAVIGIINGQIIVGLDQNEIKILATSEEVCKVSGRDLGLVVNQKKNGATTVSATIMVAVSAGLKVFATGGIGGVHRGAESSFDISADLIELSRNSMIVISSGAKAILDLKKTLEYLETFGVQVLGFQTGSFPAFYSRKSKFAVPEIGTVKAVVDIFKCNVKTGIKSSLLVTNPVPLEYDISPDIMENYIRKAISEAEEKKVGGQKLTPFLLGRIVELSRGRSLKVNKALIKNNVELGCEISREYYS